MRILEIAPPWFTVPPGGYGGIEQVVSLLTEGLVAAGHDVTLLASGGSKTAARLWTTFDVPPSDRIGSVWHDLRHCVEGYRCRAEFDLIHDHTGLVGAALGSMTEQPPVVHTLHGPWTAEVKSLHAALPSTLARVAISHHQASLAPPGVDIARVVHNAVSVDELPFRPAPRRTDGHLAFVGRASPDKGPEVAVRVARRLQRRLKMAVKIIDPLERQHWRGVVEPLLAGANVDVAINGGREHAITIMAEAEATLFPICWDEPFGLVMAESMACGTPVVGYAAGASAEVVEHGLSGLLVPVGDEDALCQAVTRASQLDPRACRAHVVRHFSPQVMVRGYEQAFRALTTATSPTPPSRLEEWRQRAAAAPTRTTTPQSAP